MEAYSHKIIPSSNDHYFNLNEENEEEEGLEDEKIIKRARSYDCVFCRRGFTTAQALGGHMNVHRKDRVNNPKSSSRKLAYNSHEEDDINQYHPQVHQPIYLAANPYNTAGRTAIFLDGFRDDGWGMSLSLQAGAAGVGVSHHVEIGGDVKGSEDLDLELRLGHYPYW